MVSAMQPRGRELGEKRVEQSTGKSTLELRVERERVQRAARVFKQCSKYS